MEEYTQKGVGVAGSMFHQRISAQVWCLLHPVAVDGGEMHAAVERETKGDDATGGEPPANQTWYVHGCFPTRDM